MPNDTAAREFTLDDVRRRIRTDLVDLAQRLDTDDVQAELASLADAYTTLGGDLELEQPAREAELADLGAEVKRLRAPIAALLDALDDVSAEDFPPRLAGLVPLLNDLETAYRA